MNCQSARDLLVSVLYDDGASTEEKKTFYHHLKACENCRGEYFEMMGTRASLQQWPDLDALDDRRGVSDEVASRPSWWRALPTVWAARPALAHLAWLLVLGVLAVFVALNTEVRLGGEGLIVRTGLRSATDLDDTRVADLVSYMVAESERRQSRAYAQALIKLQENVQVQRQYDFLEIGKTQTELEKRYLDGLEENNRMLKQIAQKVYR